MYNQFTVQKITLQAIKHIFPSHVLRVARNSLLQSPYAPGSIGTFLLNKEGDNHTSLGKVFHNQGTSTEKALLWVSTRWAAPPRRPHLLVIGSEVVSIGEDAPPPVA